MIPEPLPMNIGRLKLFAVTIAVVGLTMVLRGFLAES